MIYLHVGAHKTATTYLQSLLATNQGKMAGVDRAYWMLSQIRSVLQELQRDDLWSPEGLKWMKEDRLSPLNRLRDFTDSAADCVLSDENMVGLSTQAIAGELYPEAGKRLGRLAAALGHKQIEVWLSVRSYDEFLSSLFCETLRGGNFMAPSDLVRRYASLPDHRWPALVNAIHTSLPQSRIVVWAYEYFQSLLPEIASRLSGLPYDDMYHLQGTERASPSAEAVMRHCAEARAKSGPQRMLSMAMFEETYSRNKYHDKFYPWSATAGLAMRATYEADLADIRGRSYVEFLSEIPGRSQGDSLRK